MISGKTKILGVIGYPIGHSLSPVMHNAALSQMQSSQIQNSDFVYVAFPIAPDDLTTAVRGFEAIGVEGFSVTIPHKQAIMSELVQISELARAIGAVNTVWKMPDGWHGTNTDITGFIAPLVALDRDWSQVNVVCLGNGGAARAIVAGCAQLGVRSIQVVGRNPEKLEEFCHSFQSVDSIRDRLSIHPWDAIDQRLPNAGLIVNTTPIGMAPNPEASPLTPSQAEKIQAHAIAYDLIYTPSPTQFLQQAQQQGAQVFDGLEMLVQQGAEALRIWTGCDEVPVAVMRRSLQEKLGLL
jgi:shikimate dehydrogenase